jgi:hypothetical protein
MQTPDRRPSVGVAFDSSIEDSIDQVLALAALYSFNFRRDIRLGSVSISRNNLSIAAFCDTIGRFYGANLVVGMHEKGAARREVPAMLSAVLSRTEPGGRPLYARTVEKFNDTADPIAAIRNALSAQQDQNATVILAGPPTNLLGLLALPGNAQLVQKKVRSLVIAGPYGDADAFRELLPQWPGAIVFAGGEMNQTLQFPAACIEQDFAWAPNHPVVDSYVAAGSMPYDAPIAALAAVLYAVYPGENYFTVSEPGTMTISGSGQGQFTPNPQGRHRRLSGNPQQKEKVLQVLRQAVSTKPPEPRRGARGPQ